jgi:hypothetical protein
VSAAIIALVMPVVAAAGTDAEELARITVSDGVLLKADSGQRFEPRGFNYIRLNEGWHSTFGPEWYDAKRAERMLKALDQHGFNVVRVFIDYQAGRGIVASREATELSPTYVANFVDFLKRARQHGVYVVPTMPWLPKTPRYRSGLDKSCEKAGGINKRYICESWVKRKARYVADVVRAVKRRAPELLSTVFCWQLANEVHFVANQPPFSLREGNVTGPGGRTFDLAKNGSQQALADQAAIYWANTCTEAIHAVDPNALVSTGLFTFHAVGRTGPGHLRSDESNDARFPARPLALVKSKLALLDLHFYPNDPKRFERDLASIEWDKLKPAAEKAGMPLIMGEFGAFKGPYPKLSQARQAMVRQVKRAYRRGFDGFIYWSYDTDKQQRLWNARSGQGQIFDAMAEVKR